jgi:hypothetical protein
LHEILWAEWISVGMFMAYVMMIACNFIVLARAS